MTDFDIGLDTEQATGHLKELADEEYVFEATGIVEDRFHDKNPIQIVEEFAGRHTKYGDMASFKQAVNSVFGVTNETNIDETPEEYRAAMSVINRIIDERRPSEKETD